MMPRNASDLLASVVVFLVALPLCMGVAIASNAPPALGLLSGIIGGMVVGFVSGSPLSVSGPTAGLAVIVWQVVDQHGLAMLGPVVVLAGLFQLAGGYLRMGRLFRTLSPPVVLGVLAGIGILIFASQFHIMVDDTPTGNGLINLLSIPEAVYRGIFPLEGTTHHFAAGIGLLTITAIVLWARYRPAGLKFLPAPLVSVAVGAGLANFLQLPVQYVAVPATLLDSLNVPGIAEFLRLADAGLIGAALAIAVVGSTETLLSAAALGRIRSGLRCDNDKELRAQGIGNLLCGLLGALPLAGVIVRSVTNVEAGAQTRMSTILHGCWLLAFVVALPHVLGAIPTATLAAILVYTGYKLVDIGKVRNLAQYGRAPVAIYGVTVAGIVAIDLLTGVLIGVALSVIRLIYSLTHLEIHAERFPEIRRVVLHLDGAATFIRLPYLIEQLHEIPPGWDVAVQTDTLTHIDHACLEELSAWKKTHERTGGEVAIEWEQMLAKERRTGRDVSPPEPSTESAS